MKDEKTKQEKGSGAVKGDLQDWIGQPEGVGVADGVQLGAAVCCPWFSPKKQGLISAGRPRSLGTQPEDLRLARREPDVS